MREAKRWKSVEHRGLKAKQLYRRATLHEKKKQTNEAVHMHIQLQRQNKTKKTYKRAET